MGPPVPYCRVAYRSLATSADTSLCVGYAAGFQPDALASGTRSWSDPKLDTG